LLRDQVVSRCKATTSVTIDGQAIDLRPACGILERWDGRYELDSVGAVLWREFITLYDGNSLVRAGALFKNDFNPADPVSTPNGLADAKAGTDTALVNLGRAVRLLAGQRIALDTPLGKLQFSDRGRSRIPIHGGDGSFEGITNFVNYAPNSTTLEPFGNPEKVSGSRLLTREGYLINRGSSFVMALEFTESVPRALAILTYSQSGDPTSPHYYDQTELFAMKRWRRVLFTEKDIASDPQLKVAKVSGKGN
jgi:acyl-homoserine-lactone acylase